MTRTSVVVKHNTLQRHAAIMRAVRSIASARTTKMRHCRGFAIADADRVEELSDGIKMGR